MKPKYLSARARFPFAPQHPVISTEHIELHDKPSIFFVHGMFGNKFQFINSTEIPKRFGLDAFAVDLTGHGGRRAEFQRKRPVSFNDYVSDLIELARMGPCFFIGHSLGALAAIAAASLDTDARGNILEIFAFNSSCPRGITLPLNTMRIILTDRRYLVPLFTRKRFSLCSNQAKRFLLNATPNPDREEQFFEDESGQVLWELATGIAFNYKNVRCPVHFFASSEDRMSTLGMARKFARRLPWADVTEIEGYDHYFILRSAFKTYLAEKILPRISARVLRTA